MTAETAAERLRREIDGGASIHTFKPNGSLPPLPGTYTEAWIAEQKLEPPKFIIDSVLPVGLTLLSAPPKLGKSWFTLGAGRAISTGELFGGSLPVRQGPVLQLDLEGNQRRVQKRSATIRNGSKASADLHFVHEWPPMDSGGLDLLERKIREGGFVAVSIDVWGLFRPRRPKNADPYQHDLESGKLVAGVAHRTDCAILLIHHNRKSEAADWTAEASGTSGTTGACDTLISLSRKRGDADSVMKVTGRDIEETELAMSFKDGAWTILGNALDVLMSKTRQTIHSALCFAGKPLKPADVAEVTDLSRELVKKTLLRMLRDGTVVTDGYGGYKPKTGTDR